MSDWESKIADVRVHYSEPGGAAVSALRALDGTSPTAAKENLAVNICSSAKAAQAKEARIKDLQKHAWLLDVLCDLNRYAEAAGLDRFAMHLNMTSDRLKDELMWVANGVDLD